MAKLDLTELQAKRNEWLARIDQELERGTITRYEARVQEAACEAQYPYEDGESCY